MELAIDRSSATPIYRQIVDQIRDMIMTGVLPEGFSLPPERRLAEALGVNRSTVLNAYRELKADALVDAHVGRGTIVQRITRPAERVGSIDRLHALRHSPPPVVHRRAVSGHSSSGSFGSSHCATCVVRR